MYFFITQKISKFKFQNFDSTSHDSKNIKITTPTFILNQLLKKILFTVGTGFIMLLIIIVIASKFKIALILLPISFYLIGQFFVFNNHVKALKNQKIIYNKINNKLIINELNGNNFTISLDESSLIIYEVKSVQKNNGLLMGYFTIKNGTEKCTIPFLSVYNNQTKPFFDRIQTLKREVETKLFPII